MNLNNIHPEISPLVSETFENNILHLSLNSDTTQCSQTESIIWALCKANISSIAQIQFQFSTLPESINQNKDDAFVLNCINTFAEKKLLQLIGSDSVDYPVDLSSFSHIISSRGGLFGVSEKGMKRLASGMYFGVCIDDAGSLIAYEFPHLMTSLWKRSFGDAKKNLDSNEGVIRRFTLTDDGCFNQPELLHTELTNNCHHLVYDQGDLVGVDTERQGVFVIKPSGEKQFHALFEKESYHHINSIVKTPEYWLVLKSIESPADLTSGFGVFDHDWKPIEAISLQAERAHDFLLTSAEDNSSVSFWYCDSNHNHIRHYPSGSSVYVEPEHELNNTTRGLSESEECWIVGNGLYGRYYGHKVRDKMLANVNYIDKKSGKIRSKIAVPEAPCCIIPNPAYTF